MLKTALLASLWIAFAGAASASTLIDDFVFTQPLAQDNLNGTASFSTTHSSIDPSIIGGEREIYVNAVSGADALNGTRAGVSSSKFSLSNDSGVAGFGVLRWDGTSRTGFDLTKFDLGIDRTGFAGVNFSAEAATSLKLTILRSDTSFPLTLQFFSNDSDGTSFTFAAIPVCGAADSACLAQPGAVIGPTDFIFNYSLINLLGTKIGSGADFSNITAMQAFFNFNASSATAGSAEGLDVSIDFETGVPSPVPELSTVALNALGLVGLWLARRRRAESSR